MNDEWSFLYFNQYCIILWPIKKIKEEEKKITAETIDVKSFANFVLARKITNVFSHSSLFSLNLLNSSLVFLDWRHTFMSRQPTVSEL